MTKLIEHRNLPLHIGIIMDGNRRWAKNHGLPVASGHSYGAEVFKKIAIYCNKIGLKHLTVFAFSTENWKRSEKEVSALMFLFKKYLKSVMNEFKDENISIKFLGDVSRFSPDIKEMISTIEEETKHRSGLKLNIAMNYGSRAEIVNATKLLVSEILEKKLDMENISEEMFESHLYTKNQPNVDLIIRTGGEKRLSNFLLWQSAYAEFYCTEKLWPDFSAEELEKAINEYFNRQRRFGG